MRIGIFGGGFGLYGYLPAAVNLGLEVHTLERYKHTIESRPELRSSLPRIIWHRNESEVLSQVDSVVIARIPALQEEFLAKLTPNIRMLFLEKPLTESVKTHRRTINYLNSSSVTYQVNYLFLYTDWIEVLKKRSLEESNLEISINWSIRPPAATWKKESSLGGGLFSYYAIHFLSILYSLDIDQESVDFTVTKTGLTIFSSTSKLNLRMSVFYSEISSFKIEYKSAVSAYNWSNFSPFGTIPQAGLTDPRVPLISKYLHDAANHVPRVNYPGLEEFVCSLRERYPSLGN